MRALHILTIRALFASFKGLFMGQQAVQSLTCGILSIDTDYLITSGFVSIIVNMLI
jgi:hypothetical protein